MFLGAFYFKVVRGHRMEAEVRRLHLLSYSQAPTVKVYWKDCCSDAHTQINKARGGVHPGQVPVSATALTERHKT